MRYQIWNKQDDIVTPGVDNHTGKQVWPAQEYIQVNAQWAAIPGSKAIINTGLINGGVFMEFTQTKEYYKHLGAEITDDMTDNEVLAAIEAWEDRPPEEGEPSPEERIAAALEAQVMMSMEDE